MYFTSLRVAFLLLICSFATAELTAQILSIDRTDTTGYNKTTTWNAAFSSSLEIDAQKKLLVDATNTLDMMMQKNKQLILVAGSYRITTDDNQQFLNAGYLHLRWRYAYRNRIHPETYVQYQWDGERGLVLRMLGGANIRYNVWKHKKGELSAAIGAMQEYERWNYRAADSSKLPVPPVDQQRSYLKGNQYLRWDGQLNKQMHLLCMFFYQAPYTSFFTHYRGSGNIKLDISVSPHLDWTFATSGVYDHEPVVPLRHFYYSISNSITYKIGHF